MTGTGVRERLRRERLDAEVKLLAEQLARPHGWDLLSLSEAFGALQWHAMGLLAAARDLLDSGPDGPAGP